MNYFVRKYSANTLVISVLLAILSLFLIAKPVASLNFIVIFLGCIAFVDGVIHIVSYFLTEAEFKSYSFELLQGILGIIIGGIFIFFPSIIVSFFPFIVGAWIIVQSMIRFQFAFNIKANNGDNWAIMLLSSIVTIILGFLIIFNPFGTAVAITSISGIILLISEIINIVEAIYVIVKFK